MTSVKKRITTSLALGIGVFTALMFAFVQGWFGNENMSAVPPLFLQDHCEATRTFFLSFFDKILHDNDFVLYACTIFFHAATAASVCYVLAFWVSLPFAFLSGLAYGFFPDLRWLLFINSLQDVWALLFILLAWIFYKEYLLSDATKPWLKYTTGVMVFLSLLSCKSTIFLGCAFFLWTYIFYTNVGDALLGRVKKAFSLCWIFFATQVFYIALRFVVFGWGECHRAYNTIYIRFNWISQLILAIHHASIGDTIAYLANNGQRFWDSIAHYTLWFLSVIFCMSVQTTFQQIVAMMLLVAYIAFIVYSFTTQRAMMVFVVSCMLGIAFTAVWTYPRAQTIHMIYPMLFFGLAYGSYLLWYQSHHIDGKKVFVLALMCLFCCLIGYRALFNMEQIRNIALVRSR